MKELAMELCMESERPEITHADVMKALRLWGYGDLADDLEKVVLMMPVEDDL